MFLIHNTGIEQLENDNSVESTYTRCMADKPSMLLGRSLCVSMVYANVSQSRRHAYFPLSGPFDLSLKMSKVDQ